jgi:uncharacterized membrane protein
MTDSPYLTLKDGASVIGSVLPSRIAIVVQPAWRSEVRGLVTFLICGLAGTVVSWLRKATGPSSGDRRGISQQKLRLARSCMMEQGETPRHNIHKVRNVR